MPSSSPTALLAASVLTSVAISAAQAADLDFPPKQPVPALSPQDEASTFHLPPGYRLELMLSEPEIKEPVAAVFDGDGRMFVAEMRSYMQEIDGKDEITPVSCVSLHWSSKGDGVFDKHTVFADHLKLPRMVLPLTKGQVLIGETDSSDIYLYTDTDGDGVSDKKELWYSGGPRGGNLEHQPSGLVWSLDNWIYTTYNSYRLRWTPQGAVKTPAGANNGQWGLGEDNYGHLYFVNAGGEQGPQSFQVPVVYGGFNPKKQFEPGFEVPWSLVEMADFQGGLPRVKPDKSLNHITSSAGIDVYRGDRLPQELHGDLFFGEPVGRLVRRAKINVQEGLTVLSNPYQAEHSEFIRSTDACFRPVNIANAPDGTLYIVDMYRGIIQEGNWVREGSYLRKVVEQYAMDKVTGHGRIWRLVHTSTQLGPQPHMDEETPSQLVAHLDHPNGWWRDTAQKLLILRQDKSVIPALAEMARTHRNELARLHALWTLEGLGAADSALVLEKLKDTQPQIRVAALRVAESLLQKDGKLVANPDGQLVSAIQTAAKDSDADVALQALLTARQLNLPDWKVQFASLSEAKNAPAGLKEIGSSILHPPTPEAPRVQYTAEQRKLLDAGADTFKTLCATCHGPDAKGLPMVGAAPGAMLAPSLAGSKTINGNRDGVVKVLISGLVGEIDGKKYEGTMVSMATNTDAWIASVASYVRNSFGNHAGFVTEADVVRLRAATKDRTLPWTESELRASMPQPLTNRKDWKLTASHNPLSAPLAIDGKEDTRYETAAGQKPGMWFQIELPQPTSVCGLYLDSASSPKDYPRGYKVELSSDGEKWSAPVAEGKGSEPNTEITFPAATAKFIRITQTGSVDGLFWSIHELQVYAPPAGALAAK